MKYIAVSEFIKSLKNTNLPKQQIRTLKGQALAGNIEGAMKGLDRLTKRMV